MNLVEISEMLKGAPDTYLTQHIQSPDGSVPQYLALAELQRRQDMRARFAQQNPQTTVADDATQGIAAAAPGMMPPQGAAPMPQAAPPPQGFAKGGEVKDTTLDQILYRLGIRNLPSEKSEYESTMRRAEERLRGTEGKASNQYRKHMQNMMREQDAALDRARKAMIPVEVPAIDKEFARQAAELSPEDVDTGYREFLERQRQRKLREDAIPGYPVGTDLDKVFAPIPAGYKEGGLVEQYIKNAGRFESGNNRNAKNPFSSASGRFQFIDSTRRRLDKKYGFDPKDRSDETERARMEAYTNETIQALESANIPVTGGTLYGGHFLGQGGIKKFFEAYRKDPTTNVSEHFSAEIIRKNPAIFNPRGGKARTTLAEVMEKFDKVGGGRQRTPMTDEDMNMGAAIQVANRADRGDIGPYEDMNLAQASALAQLLEKSKLGEGPMVGYPQTQREPAPSFFHNPMDAQIKAQLLERYTNPGIAGGMSGFAGGGPVNKAKEMEAERLARINEARASAGLSPLASYAEASFADQARVDQMRADAARAKIAGMQSSPYKSMSPAGRAVEDVAGFVGGMLPSIGATAYDVSAGINRGLSGAFDPLYDPKFQEREKTQPPGPSQFFYNQSPAAAGGPGILGGAGIELPPTAPSAQPTAEEVAAAGQRMREEAGAPPVAPAAAPPVSKFDTFADQFLQELRDAKMSKEEMRQTALLQAGLGMMAGTSPNFLANVGQGAMSGLQAYQQAKAQNQALASEAYKNMMAARALGLDERRVAATEANVQSEAEYRKSMAKIASDKRTESADIKKLGLHPSVSVKIYDIISTEEEARGKPFTPDEFNQKFIQYAQPAMVLSGGVMGPNVSDTEEQ